MRPVPPSAWMRRPLDQKTKTRLELEMLDAQPEEVRALFHEFDAKHVYEAMALIPLDTPDRPAVLRRVLLRNHRLMQQDVFDGKDPAYDPPDKPH